MPKASLGVVVGVALVGGLLVGPLEAGAGPTLRPGGRRGGCFPGGTLTEGDYAGSFSVRMNVTAAGAALVLVVSGPLSTITVGKDGQVTAAQGEFNFGIEGSEVGGTLSGSGGGPLTFQGAEGASSFTMEGSADVAAVFSGSGASAGGTGSGTSALDFGIDTSTCSDMSGTVKGKFIDDTRSQVASAGATASVSEATWTATRADEAGQKLLEATEEVRKKAQEIADRARAVKGRRTVNDLLAFRELREAIDGGKYTDDKNAQHCLRKVLMDIYFPVAAKWQKDDLKEVDKLGRTATTDADLQRLRRLIAQVIYRDREAELLGCGGQDAIATVGAAASNVARRLARAKFFDHETINEALAWGRSASFLSGTEDAGGVLEAAQSWARTRYEDLLRKMIKAMKNKNPTDAERAEIKASIQDAAAAEKDASTLGAIHEAVVPAEVDAWCEAVTGGC